jgi:hypothetical protein
LTLNALDLMPRGFRLLVIQLRGGGARQPAMRAVHDGGHHLQIAPQFGGCPGWRFLLGWPLCFEKQRGIIQDALADGTRPLAPGGIQLAGLTRIAVVLCEDRRHPLAILQALPRYRHQKLHRYLCRDLALAHLLLDRFRQNLRQRQPPRYPTHTAIEPARQLLQTIAEALLHLGQQPAHFQRRLVLG